MRRLWMMGVSLALVAGCSQPAPEAPKPAATAAPAALGIRPQGDTEIQPDLTQVPQEVQQVFTHIDQNIDAHVEHLQKWKCWAGESTWSQGSRSPQGCRPCTSTRRLPGWRS